MLEANKSNGTKSRAVDCLISILKILHSLKISFIITRASDLPLNTLNTQLNLILRTTVRVSIFCHHFTDEETEALKAK